MTNHKASIELIRELSGQANILTVPRVYIELMGSIEGALLLSQMIYWSDKGNDDGWFYKKYSEWEAETTLSEYKIRKYVAEMVAGGFLETQIKKDPHGTPVTYYRLDLEAFQSFVYEKFNSRPLKNSRVDSEKISGSSITETTNIDYKESAAQKNAPTTPKKSNPVKVKNSIHPAIAAYAEIFHYSINKRVQPRIIAAIGDSENNIAVWRGILEKWLMKSFNPKNFDDMIDVFENGWKSPAKKSPAAQPEEDKTDWDAALKYAADRRAREAHGSVNYA